MSDSLSMPKRILIALVGIAVIIGLGILFSMGSVDADVETIRNEVEAGRLSEVQVRIKYGDDFFYRVFPEKAPVDQHLDDLERMPDAFDVPAARYDSTPVETARE